MVGLNGYAIVGLIGWTVCVVLVTEWLVRVLSHRALDKCAGHALAARLTVARVLPSIERGQAFLRSIGVPDEGPVMIALEDAAHACRALTWGLGRYYRHNKRGTSYEVLSYQLHLQASDMALLHDQAELVLYVDIDSGRISCRHPVEFHDGRFTRLSRSVVLDRLPPSAVALAEEARGRGYVDQDHEPRDEDRAGLS